MASRARRDIRRNLLIVFLALAGLGGLIALVGVVQGAPAPVLMAAERAKFLERRADLVNNGVPLLLDAGKAIAALGPAPQCGDLLKTQKLPEALNPMGPGNMPNVTMFLTRYLGESTYCPADDPRMKEYMDKLGAARGSVQAALAKPFLFFSRSSVTDDDADSGDAVSLRRVILYMTALALYRASAQGDTAQATDIVKEAVAVCQGLEASGSYTLDLGDHHHGPPGREGFFQVGLGRSAGYPWIAVPVIAKCAVDAKQPLDALLEMTRTAVEGSVDRAPLLAAYCMMADDLTTGENAPPGLRFDRRMIMAMTSRLARRDARILADNENAIRAAVNGPLKDYPAKIREIAGDGGFLGPKFMALQALLMNTTPVVEGRRVVAGLAVRLEAYRRDHGDYPEKLDDLVPQYLAKVPLHPRYDAPWVYARYKEGYVISENGAAATPDIRYRRFHEDIGIDMRTLPQAAPPPPPTPPPPK